MSISLSSITKTFGSEAAVNNVSLEIGEGEFFVVLGPSGCGKTTLLRLVAGLEQTDGGDITLAGRKVAGNGIQVPPEERNVGFVFQSYALWPHMNVAANVAFPLEAQGVARGEARDKIKHYLRMVELEAFADRNPAELSGGQRQRVALARCLAQRAGIILMDEPLANLDPHLRASMEEELARFHRSTAATTLYITHDQREAMALADRLAVMWEGRILQVGAPDEIYRRPVNERVARFIGRSAILDGEVLSANDGDAMVSIGGLDFMATCGEGTRPGKARIVIRPEDLSHGKANTFTSAKIGAVAYRGGFWEASLLVDGFDTPLVANLAHRLEKGDSLPLKIERAWVLPGA